jgi:UDP-glucuronate decarboxylase
MLDLAREVQSAVGAEQEITWMDLPADDPKKRQPDITKARAILGWSPSVSLAEGIAETAAYFRDLDMSRFQPPTPAVAGGGPAEAR